MCEALGYRVRALTRVRIMNIMLGHLKTGSWRNLTPKELEELKPSLVVCFAPNKYPWCRNMLMQDWPGWIADGSVDLLTVQCYVTANYREDVAATLDYVKQETDKPLFNPAMILKNGDTLLSLDQLAAQLQYNREVGTFGESQFWFDGLKDQGIQELFKLYYNQPLPFPDL